MNGDDNEPIGEVTHFTKRIWAALCNRGSEPVLRRGTYPSDQYEALTGVPAEAAELWSVLGGWGVLGMCFESTWSAGELCDARAT